MGLIKAGIGSIKGVMADEWKEFFYCDALESDILVAKGKKRVSRRSSNTKGDENIISNGSVIAVNDGQCMIIVEQGKVVEICAEPGEFIWNTSTEPSIFTGTLGEGIKNTFMSIGKRFTFGGDTGKDQRVYYVNTKEILGNKYGTANPVPFRVVDNNIGLDVDISVRCNGEYSYKIIDPILFYTNVCGNVENTYDRESIDSMLKAELLTALSPAFAKISKEGVRYSALPGYTMEISDALNEVLSKKWTENRGIKIASFGINSITAPKEDEEMIKELQKAAVYRNGNMAGAKLVDAQAEAMKSAASNKNGAMMGFMGMNAASQATSINPESLFEMGQKQEENNKKIERNNVVKQENNFNSWSCKCGKVNTGNFCSECGSKKPLKEWVCKSCGTLNTGKFCSECGAKKVEEAPIYKCKNCGFEIKDPKNPPKFCPECGSPFNK